VEVVVLYILDARIAVVAYGHSHEVVLHKTCCETSPEGSERDLVHEEDEIYDEDGDLLISVQFSTLVYYFSSSIYTSALFFDEVHGQTGK
jgi:hypothetical protein